MSSDNNWKQISRKTVLDSKFMRVYEDVIELPNGNIIDDYTLATLNDGVIIVATDHHGSLITIEEYKYGAQANVTGLPAGNIEPDEDVVQAAKRELIEETGYCSDDAKLVGSFIEYASKLTHHIYVVRIQNVQLKNTTAHESTEQISDSVLLPKHEIRNAVFDQKFKMTSTISAIVLAMPELFGGTPVVEKA